MGAVATTKAGWRPTEDMLEAIDLQATGYSMNAVARELGIAVQTIWSWNNEVTFAEQYREMVRVRTEEFQAARDAVHEQQVVMALQIIQDALSGEMKREPSGDTTQTPLRYEAAIQLLRATFWKQKAGGHQQFGPGRSSRV